MLPPKPNTTILISIMIEVNNINSHQNKEVCEVCEKFILIGQMVFICPSCDKILHQRCMNLLSATKCFSCSHVAKYNPFLEIQNFSESEKIYNDEPPEFLESIEINSNILDSCTSYSNVSLKNTTEKSDFASKSKFSTIFQNISGNKTNFNRFAAEIHRVPVKFSVIGIAETNIEEPDGQLYSISDNYTPVYQSKISGKACGSGLGLYVDNNYSFEKIPEICICNPDIESLFIKISNKTNPIYVGVLYRPPNGIQENFNKMLTNILEQLPNRGVYLMGDFNINLHCLKQKHDQNFEELILSSGYCPVISIATHCRPNCSETCIDNIFVNSPSDVLLSGTLQYEIAYHSPVFQISQIEMHMKNSINKTTIYYDYNYSNITKFCSALKENIANFESKGELDSMNQFLDVFNNTIDSTCKLETPKTTKRNSINNPWITSGIIKSISTNDKLYAKYRKAVKKKDPNLLTIKDTYTKYLKTLRKLIDKAKKKYYCVKFDECINDSRKTWKLINKLRGKEKSAMNSSFVIGGEQIVCRRMIAKKFNSYFASIAVKLNGSVHDQCPITSLPSVEIYLSSTCDESIKFNECSESEIIFVSY